MHACADEVPRAMDVPQSMSGQDAGVLRRVHPDEALLPLRLRRPQAIYGQFFSWRKKCIVARESALDDSPNAQLTSVRVPVRRRPMCSSTLEARSKKCAQPATPCSRSAPAGRTPGFCVVAQALQWRLS